MANKNGPNVTTSTSTTEAKPARKATRKPPVIERIGLDALVVPAPATPDAAAPATPAAATSATPTATPAAAPPATPPTGGDVVFPDDDPPQVTVPSVPPGFVPVNGLDLRGWRPMQSELASVPGAIA